MTIRKKIAWTRKCSNLPHTQTQILRLASTNFFTFVGGLHLPVYLHSFTLLCRRVNADRIMTSIILKFDYFEIYLAHAICHISIFSDIYFTINQLIILTKIVGSLCFTSITCLIINWFIVVVITTLKLSIKYFITI